MSKRKSQRNRKKPFGGIVINFRDRDETMEEVFGKKQLAPSEMTKSIWKFIKRKRLLIRPK